MTTRAEAVANALRWAQSAEQHACLQKEASDFAETARAEKENWAAAGSDADVQGKKKDGAREMASMWAAVAQVLGSNAELRGETS